MDRQRRGESDDAHGREGAEDEDKNGQDIFGRNFGSASSALQGLLRKLGAGFDDIVPSGGLSSAQLKGFLVQLRQDDDEAAQLDALSQLNELLSISNEESLSVFPVEQLVPVLVHLLNSEHNPDIMLLAARALTFLADVLPSSCSSIVRHGAVPAFCARLLTIEYIDLAEQSLQARGRATLQTGLAGL
ncbi:g7647 [Coccomyxa elongata]